MHQPSVTLLDGGMGRELNRRGAPFRQPEWSALALIEAPQIVVAVHADFIAAGAEVITTNSYAVVPFHIGEARFAAEGAALAARAGQLARQAADEAGHTVRVAASLPPLFGSYRPDLFQPQRVVELAQPLIEGLGPYADVWLAETQSSIAEAAAFKPLLPDDGKPFWVSFTLADEDVSAPVCLRSGESVTAAVQAMLDVGVDAILFNCCQPEVIDAAIACTQAVLRERGRSDIRIGAYANAFPPQPKEATANEGLDELRPDLDPLAYAQWAARWQAAGAQIIGGCCGIGPEHIAYLQRHVLGR